MDLFEIDDFNRMGALCSLYRRCYDGVDVTPKLSCGDAPSTAKLEKIMTGTAMKKGSHPRKSIQSSIGRLIHGTERRNVQHSAQGTPTKITANTCHNIASPVTDDIRLRRRQSLIGIPPSPATMSRRSSLRRKSDTSSNDRRGEKTPPPVNSAAKPKRWL